MSSGETISYSYDALGNRLEMEEDSGQTSYNYDIDTNQLQSFTGPNGETSLTYDERGNLTGKTVGSDTTTYTYDTDNRLTNVELPKPYIPGQKPTVFVYGDSQTVTGSVYSNTYYYIYMTRRRDRADRRTGNRCRLGI